MHVQSGGKQVLSSDEIALQAAERKRAELQARRSAVRTPPPAVAAVWNLD